MTQVNEDQEDEGQLFMELLHGTTLFLALYTSACASLPGDTCRRLPVFLETQATSTKNTSKATTMPKGGIHR